MDDITPPEAKRVSEEVSSIPFGMSALDSSLGGLPSGTTALLVGAPDAGSDAFAYTHAAQLMLGKYEPELYASDVASAPESIPDRVVYASLGTNGTHVLNAMNEVLDDDQFDALVEHLTLLDFSGAFYELVGAPAAFERDLSEGVTRTSIERRRPEGTSFTDLLDGVAADLDEYGEGALVFIDSLSDLYLAGKFGLAERSILAFLVGLREVAAEWDGLVHVLFNRQAQDVRADPIIANLLNGNVYFYSNDQGFETYRTMRVGSFGGALDREQQVVWRTSIGDTGFRVQSTKKLSPRNW